MRLLCGNCQSVGEALRASIKRSDFRFQLEPELYPLLAALVQVASRTDVFQPVVDSYLAVYFDTAGKRIEQRALSLNHVDQILEFLIGCRALQVYVVVHCEQAWWYLCVHAHQPLEVEICGYFHFAFIELNVHGRRQG